MKTMPPRKGLAKGDEGRGRGVAMHPLTPR